jgi:hypothetical protein
MATRPGYIWSGTEWVAIGQEAVLAPISYQTSAPSSPATGDVWIDSNDDVPSVNSTLYYRWKKTATGGETSFTGTDDNSLTLAYTAGYESVFINGVLQVRGSDYTATTGTSITGLTALTAGDIVMVESVMAYSVGDTYTQSVLDGKFSPITTTGMVLLNTTTFSAASTVSVNNCFSSAYDNYRIVGNLTAASANNDNLNFRLRVGGVDNSTASSYQRTFLRGISSTVTSGYAALTETLICQTNTTIAGSFTADIYDPYSARPTKFTNNFVSGGSGTVAEYLAQTGMYHNVASSFDGFSLLAATGNVSGTIKVYGYK